MPPQLVFDNEFIRPFRHVHRWFSACVSEPEFVAVIGPTATLCGEAAAAVAAAAPATPAGGKGKEGGKEGKKEKTPKGKEGGKEGKKEKTPKEPKAPKEKGGEKGEKAGPSAEEQAKIAAKQREKLLAKVFKEGGKKGVEIEGASDMGGLDFFCTTIETPDGDVELLNLAMKGMNAAPDPANEEERKGCSGHVGKMVFSAGATQLAMVAYVPDGDVGKTAAGKVMVKPWMEAVCKAVDGKLVGEPTKAESPNGGLVISAVVLSDPDKDKFALKDKDAAMKAAFDYLREKGAFPEDTGDDDDDDCCYGDDAFDDIDNL